MAQPRVIPAKVYDLVTLTKTFTLKYFIDFIAKRGLEFHKQLVL